MCRQFSPKVVAEHILWSRKKAGGNITPMELGKLVYLCHGWMLGAHGEPLLSEPVEAWPYGPVLPSVYHAYKGYGASRIEEEGEDKSSLLGPTVSDLIRQVEEGYRDKNGWELSDITHQPGTPWETTVCTDRLGAVIDNNLIKSHFESFL